MATIHDVAQAAGVSATTVSRYLNNRIELPPSTTARIDAAIAQHDYRPNLLARRLSTGKTDAIGLIIPEIREPFFAELASAVEDEADRHGYTIFISSTRSDRAREIASLNRLRDHHVDGLILLTNTLDDGTLARLVTARKNVVVLDEDIPGVNVPKIFVENTAGAHRATRYLIAAGHRRIGYLGGPLGLFSSEERYAGHAGAMAEAGLPLVPTHVVRGSFSPNFARQAMHQMLRDPMPPTAIFASSDYLAIGALQGLQDFGVRVPHEMSFISFDDTPLGAMLSPPLTAIRQPIAALGRHGFLALFAVMHGEPAPRITRLPVELMERDFGKNTKNEGAIDLSKRVLIAGESWTVHSIHQKGFDSFTTTEYAEGVRWLRDGLESNGWSVDYQPSHVAARDFPMTAEALRPYNAVILSDIGANTLLLHPDTFSKSKVLPNRLHALRDYVGAGGGLVMVGGYLTFQGIEAKGQYAGTAVEAALPVTLMPGDDRIESPQGVRPEVLIPEHPMLKGVPSDWPMLLGYNRVTPKADSAHIASIDNGDPLLVAGYHGAGRGVAFTSDCGPHWAPPPFVEWAGYAALWNGIVEWAGGLR